jgi:spermidine synthase
MAALVTGLFFASGVVAVAYEVVWVRALGLVVGNSPWGLLVVVAATMGGMAIGSALVARLADRLHRHLRLFAAAEAAAAVVALATSPCLVVLQRVAAHFSAVPLEGWGLGLVERFVVACAFLLLPTVAMGATLPLLVARIGRHETLAWRVGKLFAANAFGAVVGVLASTFVALPAVGEKGTLAGAATLGLAVAAVAWSVERWVPAADRSARVEPDPRRLRAWLLYPAMFGFVALACDLVWTRIFVLYLGSRVYAFALILAIYLLGVAAGSTLAKVLARRPRRALAATQLAIGVVLGLQVPLLARFGDLLAWFPSHFRLQGFTAVELAHGAAVAAVILLPTMGFGASFPLAVAADPGRGDPAASTGAVGAAGISGGIVGAIAYPLVLVPAFGTQSLLVGLGVVAAVAGLLLAEDFGLRVVTAAAAVLLVVEATVLPSRAVLSPDVGARGGAIVALRESASATVVVRRVQGSSGPWLSLELNGVPVAGTSPELLAIQRLQGHLPLLLDTHPETVLDVGFGSGGAAWAVSRHPLRRIEVAEISPEVLEVSNRVFSPINHGVLADPRVTVLLNDGRNLLLASRERFDVILSGSIHPVYAGNSTLYTREYFELCRRHLRPGGVVSMRLPMYYLTQASCLAILRAFREVFPGACVWYDPAVLNEYTVVTGTAEARPIQVRWGALANPVLQPSLAEAGISDPASLARMLLLGPREVAALVDRVMPHVDDFPEVEYDSGRMLDRDGSWLRNFHMLFAVRARGNPFAAFPGDWAHVSASRDAIVRAQLRELEDRVNSR